MALEIYLRSGAVRVVPEAATGTVEWTATATGLRRILVSRDAFGAVVGRLDADAVLAYRALPARPASPRPAQAMSDPGAGGGESSALCRLPVWWRVEGEPSRAMVPAP